MSCIARKYPKKIVAAVLTIAAIMGATSCSDKRDRSEAQAVNNDSIAVWIEHARKSGVDSNQRIQYLKRAATAIERIEADTSRIKYLSKLSLSYLRTGDSLKFRAANKKTASLARDVGDSTALAEAFWDLAFYLSHKAVIDSAYFNYSEAQKIFESIGNDVLSARMLYNMAVQQAKVKDYTGSEISTIRAIELLKPLNRYEELYNCYNNLGSITTELKEYDRAAEYYIQALTYLEYAQIDETKYLGTLNNLGVTYQEQGLQDRAITYFRQVLDSDSLRIKKPQLYARSLDNLAYSQFKLGQTAGVLNKLELSRNIRDSINDIPGLSRSAYHLSEYSLAVKDTASAMQYASQAINYARQSSNNKRLLETLQLFTRIDPQNVAAHTRRYIAISDSLQQSERQIRNKFARIRFETDEFIAQNELLARQRQLWIGIAAGLFLLASSVLIIIRQQVRNQKLKFERQQQEANEEIFNLMLSQNQKIEEGKQSEQKRISEELHDGILGQMNGIRMVLLGLNKKADQEAVSMRSQAIEKLQKVQEEIRTISHELNDAAYQKFHNFILSIEDLLKSIASPAGLKYSFVHNGDLDWDGLRGDIKINLYRIVQEGLQNCIKHAKATEVKLNFDFEDDKLLVELKDNGKGFDPKKGKKGIGHKNIESRVKKLNGSWEVRSTMGKGTTLMVKVPRKVSGSNEEADALQEAAIQEI